MKKNMGTIDRAIRILLAVVVIALYFLKVISGTLAVVMGIIALIFIVTGFVGVCPLYIPFKISTCRAKK